MNRTTSALQNPLDRLEAKLLAAADVAEAMFEEHRLDGINEALGLLEETRREIEAIDAEHVRGRVYGGSAQ